MSPKMRTRLIMSIIESQICPVSQKWIGHWWQGHMVGIVKFSLLTITMKLSLSEVKTSTHQCQYTLAFANITSIITDLYYSTIYFSLYMGLCVFGSNISILMVMKIFWFDFTGSIESEIWWIISQCLGLGSKKTGIYALCVLRCS